MPFRNVRKQAAKHRTKKVGQRINQSAVLADFMMPNQRASTPVSPSDISNAVLEESNVEFMIAVNIPVSPKTITFIRAMIKAMTKNPIQM